MKSIVYTKISQNKEEQYDKIIVAATSTKADLDSLQKSPFFSEKSYSI